MEIFVTISFVTENVLNQSVDSLHKEYLRKWILLPKIFSPKKWSKERSIIQEVLFDFVNWCIKRLVGRK